MMIPTFEYVCKIFIFASLGKKDKLRVYYLSWLRNKILHNDPEVEKKQGWTTVGDLEGCVHYKVGKFQESQRVLFFQDLVSVSFKIHMFFEDFNNKPVSATCTSFLLLCS